MSHCLTRFLCPRGEKAEAVEVVVITDAGFSLPAALSPPRWGHEAGATVPTRLSVLMRGQELSSHACLCLSVHRLTF